MPNYTYACPSCAARFERYLPLSRWQEVQFCQCGHPTERVIAAPLLVIAQPECRYDSPIDGTPITSWAQRREDLAKHGCVPYDPEQKTDYLRRQHDQEVALDKAIDGTIDESMSKMPYRKRAKLHSELTEQGMNMALERRTP